jgi:hypothetical protein
MGCPILVEISKGIIRKKFVVCKSKIHFYNIHDELRAITCSTGEKVWIIENRG